MYHAKYLRQKEKQEELLSRKNEKSSFYNGIYLRWKNPVLTRDHVPLHWRYDLNPETNPFFMERLGVNAVFNAGAIYLDGKYCLVVRVEGNDRKSFFAVAESENGIDNFRFREKPIVLPKFVDGKYVFYTRPMDGFIETGSGGGIGFGLADDITNAVIEEERMTSLRKYHTITESKNGAGAVPIETEKGWLHLAHGVRNTAAGLRYVLYVFVTDLYEPWKVIAEPSGYLLAPQGKERVGDVSNVGFTNGAIVRQDGAVYIYYASSDTRLHVATTDIKRLLDYAFHTPGDPLRSADCVKQRCELIDKNIEFMREVQSC